MFVDHSCVKPRFALGRGRQGKLVKREAWVFLYCRTFWRRGQPVLGSPKRIWEGTPSSAPMLFKGAKSAALFVLFPSFLKLAAGVEEVTSLTSDEVL